MVDVNPRAWRPGSQKRGQDALGSGLGGGRRSKAKKKKKRKEEEAAAAAAAVGDATRSGTEAPAPQMTTSRSGRMRKVVKYGHNEPDVAPKGGFNRTPEELAQLQKLKDRFKDHKGYYPTGGQASSVKWLKARIAAMDSEKAGGASGGDMEDEDHSQPNKDLEREQKAEQKKLNKEAKDQQRKMIAEDQRKIREHRQRAKEERMAEKLWSETDDMALATAIAHVFYSTYGRQGAWPDVPGAMGTSRSHDSCRHRWNAIKTQPAIEAAVQAAVKEHDEALRKTAEETGQALVERNSLGPERVTSPKADDRAPSALRHSGGSACNRCKRLKRKCDGGLPCRACIEKGLGHECKYKVHRTGRPSPVNVPEYQGKPHESCRICKAAAGICRKWNTPGHLYDPSKPTPVIEGSSPTRVFSNHESSAASQSTSSAQGTDWTVEEDKRLRDAVLQIGTSDWSRVSDLVGSARAAQACRGRWRRLGAGGARLGAVSVSAQQTLARLAGGFRWQGLVVPKKENDTEDYWKTYWAEAAKKQEQEQREEAARIRKQQEEERQKSQKPEIHEELRECPGSKLPYTKSEFEEEFGGLVEWEAAKVVPNPIHTVYDAKLSPFTDAIRKKAEVAKKIAARHAERAEAERTRRLAAAAEGASESQKQTVHVSIPGKQSFGLEFGKYICVDANGEKVHRVVVDGKVVGSPADESGLPLGLVLSHIEGDASQGDEIDKYMARKRQVAGMPLLTLMQTLRIAPRPIKIHFDGRVAVPNSARHEVNVSGRHTATPVVSDDDASASPATNATDAISSTPTATAADSSTGTAGENTSATTADPDSSAIAADSSDAGAAAGDPTGTTTDSDSSTSGGSSTLSAAVAVSSASTGDGDSSDTTAGHLSGTVAAEGSSENTAISPDAPHPVGASATSDGTDSDRGEQGNPKEMNVARVTVRAIFGQTVECLSNDKTKMTATFTVQDEEAEFLTAEVRTTTVEELAEAGVPTLSSSDVSRNWSEDEDKRLLLAIAKFGHQESTWEMVSAAVGGHRSGLSCKSRWARVRAASSAHDECGETDTKAGQPWQGAADEESAASAMTNAEMHESSSAEAGNSKQQDIAAYDITQPTFAAATAGLEEIRRMNDTKQKSKSSKAQEKEWVPKVRVADLSGKQALLCKLLLATEPVLAVHCPQNSGVSYRCIFREGARTPLVDLERACTNIYGRIDASGSTSASGSGGGGFDSTSSKDKDSSKGEWRMTSTTVEDAIEATNGEQGAGRQYTLVRQMNWWGCNACGQDVDEKYASGFCCDVYKSLSTSVPKSKRTTRRCRAVPHFVKNLELIEITEDGEERVKHMVIPPVDPTTGKTLEIDTTSGGGGGGLGGGGLGGLGGGGLGGTGTGGSSTTTATSTTTTSGGTVDRDTSPPAPAWSPSQESSGKRAGKRRLSVEAAAGMAVGTDNAAAPKRPR